MRRSHLRRNTLPMAEEPPDPPRIDDTSRPDEQVQTIHPTPVSPAPPAGDARVQGGPRQKDLILEEYDAKLKRVKLVALITSALYSSSWFLGFCALTWATVVVLGGFVPELSKRDFYSVSFLLLLEAIRLAASTFFGNIVTRSLTSQSTDPTKFRYDDSVRQIIVAVFRIVDLAFQLTVIAISVLVPLQRWRNFIGEHAEDKGKPFDGLRHSLRIFYFVVLLNATVATIAVIHSTTIASFFVTSYSLRRYYDKVVWRDMYIGLLRAHDFDFVKFAFKTQSDEYRRRMRPPLVGAQYKDLIAYLFAHPKGFEAAHSALSSDDIYEQEAAANIVGLWAQLDRERRVLRLQRRLLSKLADVVDNQETGRAATLSFEQLAKVDREGVLKVRNESGSYLVDILVDRIDEVVSSRKYDRSLMYVKALLPLLPPRGGSEKSPIKPRRRKALEGALWAVFRSNSRGCLKRTKAVAGYALRRLTNDEEPTEREVNMYVRDQPLEREEFIMAEEYRFLVELLGGNEEVLVEWQKHKLEVRQVQPPPQAVITERIVAVLQVTLLLIVGASVLIFRYRTR